MGLTCKICFETASGQGTQARITSCGHVFCQDCATIWFRTEAACPVCRSAVAGLPALIALFDHDAGLQSPSLGFDDETSENGGETETEAQVRESPSATKSNGVGSSGSPPENGGEPSSTGREGAPDRGRVADCLQRRNCDNEDVQVKYVLGKVAERWQQVMVERARLRVQVASLEKTKQELTARVQHLSDENAVMKQAMMGGFRPRGNSRWDLDCDARESGFYSDSARLQGLDRESEMNAMGSYLSNLGISDIGGYGSPDTGYGGIVRGVSSRAPAKVEERLSASKWELAHTFTMHSGPVHGIAVNPSGNLVATASWDHLCRVYDVHLEEEVAVLAGHMLGLYAVKFSPAKRDLVGTVSSDQTCRLWNTDTGECLRVLEGHTDEVNGLSFKPGTHLLATASDDATSMIWDAEKGISVTALKGHRHGVYGVCFQPNGGHLVATASFDFTAKLWDPRSAEDVQTLRGHLEDVIGVDIDDSGTYLATGSDDKTCRVWDLRMGHPIVVLQAHSGEVKRVVFSPYGKLLATTSGDTTVRLFDTTTWDCAQILSSHSDHVFDVAWSPTADFLVTASHDRLWKLWQPRVPSLRNSIFTANNHQRYPVSQVNNDVMRAERMAMV